VDYTLYSEPTIAKLILASYYVHGCCVVRLYDLQSGFIVSLLMALYVVKCELFD